MVKAMIENFSLRDIIQGCFNTNDFDSPECKLLNRVSKGEPIPEYPEIMPEKQYFYQLPDEDFERGPTAYFQYFDKIELLEDIVQKHSKYPSEIWEA